MKILLTLDLNHPPSPERQASQDILRNVWDQLQVTENSLEVLRTENNYLEAGENKLAAWAETACSQEYAEQYRTLAPSPIESYDLIIAANLGPAGKSFFTSLKIPTLILRNIPCDGFSRFLLAHANFSLPEEFCTELPPLKNLYHQEIPIGDVSKEERHWWLANRFLINQENQDPSILAIGTTLYQTERIMNGNAINLYYYADELMELLKSCPNLYYCSRQPMDQSELRFMKTLNATCPSLFLPHLLASNAIDSLISIDSGIVPLAAAFKKPVRILGNSPSWSVILQRCFRNSDFIKAMAGGKLLHS